MNNPIFPQPSGNLSMFSRSLVIGVLITALLGVTFVVHFFLDETNADAQEHVSSKSSNSFEPTPQQLSGLKIEPVVLETFHTEQAADGKIAINDDTTTPVFSPYSGRVVSLTAKAGDVVKKNDPLFSIDATEFIQAQNDLIAAVAALSTAKALLNLAVITEKREHDLYESKGVALKVWQQSQVDLATARETLRSDEIAYAEAKDHLHILGKNDQDIEAIENVRDAQKVDSEAVVNAPRDGVVIQRQIGLGQYIQAGATNPVYTIGDLSSVWLVANVNEVDAPLMHVGMPVEVKVMAIPDHIYKAKLSYVGATVDPLTHRLPVRAEVDNSDGSLKPEMFAHFNIMTGNDEESLAVPGGAIVYEGSEAHVWVVNADKTITLRSVHVGRTNNGHVEVLEGLKANETVVTRGALFIDRAAAGE